MRSINFTNPFQARKWLNLLKEDKDSGIIIQPNLKLGKNTLGFSFDSNEFGLRGPNSTRASAVVFGTSYAMGFAVDRGYNWYDKFLKHNDWFNAGLPVGAREWESLLVRHYHGSKELGLFIYHPNFWNHAICYHKQRISGVKAFRYFRWKTKTSDCLYLWLKQNALRLAGSKKLNKVLYKRQKWIVNPKYSFVDISANSKEISIVSEDLAALLNPFKKVICIRVPVKEQLVLDQDNKYHFSDLHDNYDKMWLYTQEILGTHGNAFIFEAKGFRLEHYHRFDTHLNISGNAHLRECIRDILFSEKFKHLLVYS
jgi:hypothetical protein